ncbi:hypothetical protein HBA55_14580 [Pseudomaricurvus alkylphenolicus]|uniref:hypothetical protein n=1 Tax=Pseudomaricurvus alkylphenolicus TaxID=1306991 RepID=UPI00141DCBCC|nr:hypothetical protein [Pseudomaricurvus alkylphenolicus]NIB40824.1 hypothetical protein [Pseudomaricurvus alkylphenolicus]
MTQIDQTAPNTTTYLATHRIRPGNKEAYERCMREVIHQLLDTGSCASIDVIELKETAMNRYLIVIKTTHSETHDAWFEQINDLLWDQSTPLEKCDNHGWFVQPSPQAVPLPPYWKRALLTISCVYPMIMLLTLSLDPLIGDLPQALAIFVIVVLLASSLTHPILPWANRVMAPWLHKNTSPKR